MKQLKIVSLSMTEMVFNQLLYLSAEEFQDSKVEVLSFTVDVLGRKSEKVLICKKEQIYYRIPYAMWDYSNLTGFRAKGEPSWCVQGFNEGKPDLYFFHTVEKAREFVDSKRHISLDNLTQTFIN